MLYAARRARGLRREGWGIAIMPRALSLPIRPRARDTFRFSRGWILALLDDFTAFE